MNNKVKVFIILAMIVAMLVCFAACQDNENDKDVLGAPTGLAMNGSTLSWNSVANATAYEVVVDSNDAITTTDIYCELTFSEYKNYTIKVRAVKGNTDKKYSDYSKITYTKTNQLSTPVITVNGKDASWTEVTDAQTYDISVTNKAGTVLYSGNQTETSFSFDESEVADTDKKFTATGKYTIKVVAKINDTEHVKVDSQEGVGYYVVSEKLATPTINSITTSSVKWKSIANVSSYKCNLYFAPADGSASSLVATYQTTNNSYSIAYMDFDTHGAGKYYCTIQAIGDGEIYTNSDVTTRESNYDLTVLNSIASNSFTLTGETLTWSINNIDNVKSFTVVLLASNASGSSSLNTIERVVNVEDGRWTMTGPIETAGNTPESNKIYYVEKYIEVASNVEFDSTKEYFTYSGSVYVAATGITEFATNTTYYTRKYVVATGPKTYNAVASGETYNAANEYYTFENDTYVKAQDRYLEVESGTPFNANEVYYILDGSSYAKQTGLTAFEQGVTYYTFEEFTGFKNGVTYYLYEDTDFTAFEDGVSYYLFSSAEYSIDVYSLFFTTTAGKDTPTKSNNTYYGKYFDISLSIAGISNNIIAPASITCDDQYLSYKQPNKVDSAIARDDSPIKSYFNSDAEYNAFVAQYDGYYYIEEIGQLQYIAKDTDGNYVLLKDLDNESYKWATLENFEGILDGNNHSISNLVYTNSVSNVASFVDTISATGIIKNLYFKNVSATVTNINSNISGIANINKGTIDNCYVQGSLSGAYEIAAVTRENRLNAIIKNTQANVSVSNTIMASGFVGINDGTIQDCISLGNISASDIYDSVEYTSKDLLDQDVTYYTYNTSTKVYTSVGKPVEGNDSFPIPSQYSTLYTMHVSTTMKAAGFVNINQGIISYSYATGTVSATATDMRVYAGGFVAYNDSQIFNCYSGHKFSTDSTKRGTVTANALSAEQAGYAGGFVACNAGSDADIKYCYSTNRVSASTYLGGFVGYNDEEGTIKSCYSTGGITDQATENRGAFAGKIDSENASTLVTNCYFYNAYSSENYNNTDGIATKITGTNSTFAANLLNALKTGDAACGNVFTTIIPGYTTPVLANMIYVSSYEDDIYASGLVSIAAYIVVYNDELSEFELIDISDIDSSEDIIYTVIGDDSRKGTALVVYEYDETKNVVIYVTVK